MSTKNTQVDPIKELAARLLNTSVEQVTDQQRKKFKAATFMYAYSFNSVSYSKVVKQNETT